MKDAIVKLREKTGAGVMECKRALDEVKGDISKAEKVIFERGLARAETKQERSTGSGMLHGYVHNDRVGVLLDVRCETDFVVKSDAFREFVHNLALHIAGMNPKDVKELLTQPYVKDPSINIEELLKQSIATIGENMKIERFTRYEI